MDEPGATGLTTDNGREMANDTEMDSETKWSRWTLGWEPGVWAHLWEQVVFSSEHAREKWKLVAPVVPKHARKRAKHAHKQIQYNLLP